MKIVYLLLPVTFDPKATDVESVATAVDVLLDTATSTLGVLDDYGPVKIGETELLDSLVKEYREAKEALDTKYREAGDRIDVDVDRERDLVEACATALADTIEDMAG